MRNRNCTSQFALSATGVARAQDFRIEEVRSAATLAAAEVKPKTVEIQRSSQRRIDRSGHGPHPLCGLGQGETAADAADEPLSIHEEPTVKKTTVGVTRPANSACICMSSKRGSL